MKRLLLLLFAACLLVSCSDDDNKDSQEYTSIVFFLNEDVVFPNCVVGYFDTDGYCHKIAELGDMSKGKYSEEIILQNNDIKEVYFFTDYRVIFVYESIKLDYTFFLKINQKNIFDIPSVMGIAVDKREPKEYPH